MQTIYYKRIFQGSLMITFWLTEDKELANKNPSSNLEVWHNALNADC
jgi:hypothetical protein